MLTLYHNDMSSCSQKVRFMLAAKGLEWSGVELDLREGDQHKPTYLKLNPNGVVPTLVYNDQPIIESSIICEFLDDLVPEPGYRPRDPLNLALMRNWIRYIDDHIHAQLGVASTALAFRHILLAKGRDAALAKINAIPNEAKRARMLSVNFEGEASPLFRDAIMAFRRMLILMQDKLATRPWLIGDSMSLADVVTLPYLVRLDHLFLSGLWRDLPQVAPWFDRMRAAPEYQTALVKWFDMPVVAYMQDHGAAAWPTVEAQIFAGSSG